ncbi:1-deoxy-D-xylulose-5-phosphate reductoisomerase [Stratiformator vulcanicus]|uniref:1-deoxy-D-xylulose 5-phosphate reductoisomerase n=1 Tax=Stratiformator vulcanicus TaxID=2527980 RepID=A0A517R768_9PLAN|nr:1-deoxy-D-xylulose-5-phosphate reductoisomerase [Stratiformator vulcanicus]QDT39661.1 1-deoxy-D-xylulose 5-phosphate reductoisomerase [Stratiformator vulcanicus]
MPRIALFGSTGSIGTNCLDVVRHHRERFDVVALSAHSRSTELAEQCREFGPKWAVLCDENQRADLARDAFDPTELRFGADVLEEIAASPEVDTVVSAIVGAAGLRSTWAAIEAGKRVALANKETMVVAGPLVTELARTSGAEIIPVDSEHSAIFQAMQSGAPTEVRRVVLTASGGPFRGRSRAELEAVTPEQALDHPTWDMGPKITIDSATMTNKALELIEAKWLFDLRDDQIEIIVHPQSIVHSFVEFVDGSVLAQLSPPDMRLPIQYALTFPDRCEATARQMDWRTAFSLEFEPPDEEAFPALAIGREVAAQGGTSGAVFNAANEAAVERFLAGELKFTDISRACRAVLDAHDFDPDPALADLLRVDQWSRTEVMKWTS